jgi:hypothetical protein
LSEADFQEESMSQAKSISLNQFTGAVQSAVKSAAQKHSKLKIEVPQAITFGHLIWGFPVPESILANVTLAETQAFADTVAASIAPQVGVALDAKATGGKGAIYSAGGHFVIGIPAVDHLQLEK